MRQKTLGLWFWPYCVVHRPTDRCRRIATARFYNGYVPAKKWVIVATFACSQSRDFKRWGLVGKDWFVVLRAAQGGFAAVLAAKKSGKATQNRRRRTPVLSVSKASCGDKISPQRPSQRRYFAIVSYAETSHQNAAEERDQSAKWYSPQKKLGFE